MIQVQALMAVTARRSFNICNSSLTPKISNVSKLCICQTSQYFNINSLWCLPLRHACSSKSIISHHVIPKWNDAFKKCQKWSVSKWLQTLRMLNTKVNCARSYSAMHRTPVGIRTFSSLAFVSPFAFFRSKLQKQHDKDFRTDEVLSNIPKEVFKQDKVKKVKKRNFVMQFWFLVWMHIRYSWRLLRVMFTFGPILCLYPITYIKQDFIVTWWKFLLWACECTGPTFIKLGQWASTRRDLFPATFCDIFSKLHRHTKIHSWYITKIKLRKAFGKNWKKIFVKIEKKPIGSGCIAQVITFHFQI